MAVVKLLKEYPDYAPILGFWTYMEWFRNRSVDFDLVVKSIRKRIDDTSLPVSWVAIEDSIPVGMVSLKKDDLWSRKDLNPWLVSLYVTREFRKHGIGTMLIDSVIAKSKELGFSDLYLFVDSDNTQPYLRHYYFNRGWKFFEDAFGNDKNEVKIFSHSL